MEELKNLKEKAEADTKLQFDKEHLVRCLDANKHNHETTCYYLVLSKMQRDGKIVVDS